MKLIQLNTWSCKLSPAIERLFRQEQPDFVCMQEVVKADYDGNVLDTIDDALNAYPFSDSYYAPLVEFSFMHHTASRGNMIVSQLPIAHTNQVWTHGKFIEDFDYIDSGGYNSARNFIHIETFVEGKPLHILTIHGYHIKEHKHGNAETIKACQMLADYASQLEGAVIITGDFNLAPMSESIQHMDKSFRNLSSEHKLTTTRNHLTSKTEVCDYIFVNDQVTVNEFRMPDVVVSDHNALVLQFDI